jgi:type VI secretion system protein ImpK
VSDNPFAEPDDNDRTVIRPVPGGRRATSPPPAATPAPRADAARAPHTANHGSANYGAPFEQVQPASRAASNSVAEGAENLAIGDNPLAVAAAPLLQLMARLRNTANAPDAGDLRERAVREMRNFEQAARDGGVPMEQLRPAHYALCASLDDIVLNTPWGSAGGWDARSLVSTFHQEVRSGERFFDLLGQMKQNPGTFLPVIELMYMCLSLGLMGRYRLSPRGPGEIDRLREDTYAVIARQRGSIEPGLSPHWKGIDAPYRPSRAVLPVWVVGAAALAVIGVLFVYISTGLNAASDDLYARMLAAPPATMPTITRAAIVVPPPPPPAPPEPTSLDKLRTFLKPEIDQGLVSVLGTQSNPIVRINNRGLFASGSATVTPAFIPLLDRIGAALSTENGAVQVIGYTDNQPIKTVQFPSNFQLSTSRAQAAKAIVARTVGNAERVSAEGRGEADPLASNATPEGREQNRRIDIVLHRQD